MSRALLVVDMQKGFDDPLWGKRNNPQAEHNGLRVLQYWRASKRQVVLVRHDSTNPRSPLQPGRPGHKLKPGFEPRASDWVIGKTVNSAFIGTNLEVRLREAGINELTVFGITTDQCVSTTMRMASNLGFQTTLVEDACACFGQMAFRGTLLSADAIHRAHVATLLSEFGHVVAADDIIPSNLNSHGAAGL